MDKRYFPGPHKDRDVRVYYEKNQKRRKKAKERVKRDDNSALSRYPTHYTL